MRLGATPHMVRQPTPVVGTGSVRPDQAVLYTAIILYCVLTTVVRGDVSREKVESREQEKFYGHLSE